MTSESWDSEDKSRDISRDLRVTVVAKMSMSNNNDDQVMKF